MSGTGAVSAMHRWRPGVTWLIVVVALVARLGFGAWQDLSRPIPLESDETEYDTYAWNLAQGHGYRGISPNVSNDEHLTAYRSPGPSLLYAAMYLVVGHRPAAIRILNCCLGAVACLLIIAIGARTVGETAALIAAAIWAVWPISIVLSATLLSEQLALVALLCLTLVALDFARRPSLGGALLTGFVLGANLLIHPSRLFLLPFLALWALVQFRRSGRSLALAVVIPVVAALVLSPWMIRNAVVFGRFIPFSTMGGSVLLQGNNRIVATTPDLLGYNVWDTAIPEYADALRAPNNELGRDSVAKQFAVRWLRLNRGRWVAMAIAKVRRGWTPFLRASASPIQRLVLLASWGSVLLIGLVGFVPWLLRFLKAGHPGWLIHLVILHVVALNAIFFGYGRYRYVVEPLCVLLAAGSVVWLFRRGREQFDQAGELGQRVEEMGTQPDRALAQ